MSLWTYLGLSAKPRRIIAYFLHPVGTGRWETVPIGTMPAPSKRYECYLRDTHGLFSAQFIVDEFDGATAGFMWSGDMVEAICFDSRDTAERYPGFEQLSRQELAGVFDHFEGWLGGGKTPLKAPAGATDRYDFV